MSHVKTYDQFLNEAILVVKRKYTENHPERKVSDYAPVREKVLSFMIEKGKVTETELLEFLRLMNEESGRKTTIGWVKANSKFFKVRESGGETYYTLSDEGKRVHKKMTAES